MHLHKEEIIKTVERY